MKKLLVPFCLFTSLITANIYAQLPPVAQALYDEAVAQDAAIVNYAITAGAEILPTPDGNSFYIQWFPTAVIPANTPVIVSLHGSGGYAFHEFYNWHTQAQLHGCGIIALQWYRGNASVSPGDYFTDDTLYNYIDSALTAIAYPSGKAFLHGFSRGAARTYAIIFEDIQSGNNYFCTSMANSGKANTGYPLYAEIEAGVHGTNLYAGKRWTMFCGGLDPNPTESGCPGMDETTIWLNGLGATVDLSIQDATLGHDGFQLPPAFPYRDSILDNYLMCFNGTLSSSSNQIKPTLQVFPNPFYSTCTFQLSETIQNGVLTIFDLTGKKLVEINGLNDMTFSLDRNELSDGIYFYQLSQNSEIISAGKLSLIE